MNWKNALFLLLFIFTIEACTENKSINKVAQNTENQDVVSQKDTNVSPPNAYTDSVKVVKTSLDSPGKATKYIYFTIDDGPSSYSDDILELAKSKNVKMTVFLVGMNMEWKAYDDEFKAYHDSPLIEMCNHSYSHANNHYNRYYRNPKGVLEDFYKNIVKLNLTNAIARFPGSPAWAVNGKEKNVQHTRRLATTLLKEKGFRIFGWDSEWEFSYRNGAPKGTAEQVMAEIEEEVKSKNTFTKNHCVLLLHERMFQQKWEIAKLVTLLQQKGYVFEHLRNYPKESI